MGLRRLSFYKDGVLIPYADSWIATATSVYSSSYAIVNPFKGLEAIGLWENKTWLSGDDQITNQKLIVTFPEVVEFDEIRYINGHSNGLFTESGAKTVEIFTSTATDISVLWADPIPEGTQIFSGEFTQHVDSDVPDEQILSYGDLSG